MGEEELQQLYDEIAERYGLPAVPVFLERQSAMPTVSGLTRFDPTEILVVADRPRVEMIETLRHEAAHVAAGRNVFHGPTWMRWALRLGCRDAARHCESV